MAMITVEAPAVPVPVAAPWRASTRIAFRFFFTYFVLYVCTTQMLGGLLVLPVGNVPDFGSSRPITTIVAWTATHVFRITYPLVITGSGSGDKTYDWVHAFCVLVASVAITAISSYVDRRRDHYRRLHTWFHLFARFALGSTMMVYGTIKVIPVQMPAPGLTRLLEPFGQFSPMGVLWYSVGASRPYEIFCGSLETLGGVLLFMPRTATLGALVCLADAIQIFTLNMTYDVPVKLFSFHLIVLSLVLLAPEAKRLARVLLNGAAEASTQRTTGRSPRAIKILAAAQLVFGAYLVVMGFRGALEGWRTYGGGAPRSPLYGIWTVADMSIDGHTRSPLVTDYDRWRRVVFDRPTFTAFQRMDDTFAIFGAAIDQAARSLTLSKANDRTWTARLTFERPAPDRLQLEGVMDGHKIRMRLELFDRNKFLLVTRGFHWVQEYPFNR
jgi:hypothetical protein